MAGTVIPFGPQHPVLPEPLQLKLVVKDEIVEEAVPQMGYVHRGLEALVKVKDFKQMTQVVERICGICSSIHGLTYCLALEELMGVQPPPRADYLRVAWSELHRVHSHLLWLGLFADALGFESLFMQYWRIREKVMDIMEATAGNRVIISVNVIGGTRRDIDEAQRKWVLGLLDEMEREVKATERALLHDYAVKRRTVGKGVLTREQAYDLGAAGPTLRGSGVAQDMRQLGFCAYKEVGFEPVVEHDGDSWARAKVRYRETLQSIELVRRALAGLPAGETMVKAKGKPPAGELVVRSEQPRGELLYYVKTDGSKNLERLRVRTPTFANVPPLVVMLPGLELADVPVVVLSIDPCVSCTER